MSSSTIPQIIVVGPVQGYLRTAFEKLAKIYRKQKFSFCIIVGDLFSDGSGEEHGNEVDELLSGSIEIPLPTYFTVGDFLLPPRVIEKLERPDSHGEVCTNLFFLSRKGMFKTSEGIRIISVGGRFAQNQSSITVDLGDFEPLYLEKEANSLAGAHSTEILISNQWPAQITSGSALDVPEKLRTDQGIECLSSLCSKLKPRYHFSASPDASWEREPFRHPQEYGSLDLTPITYFRSLGSIRCPIKEWFFAFRLDRNNPPPAPANTTATPFTRGKKRRTEDDDLNGYSRYSSDGHRDRSSKKTRKNKSSDQEECFMCIKNMETNNSEHLLSSIGETSVVTVPRGPLPLPSTFPQLSWSGQILIIPNHHAGEEGWVGGRSETEFDEEFGEMTRFRKALCKMVSVISGGRLGAVCWDTNRTGIRHMHWQWMPAPVKLIKDGLVESAFKALAQQQKCPPFERADADLALPVQSDYFRLWIYTPARHGSDPLETADLISGGGDDGEGVEKSMYFRLPSEQHFNIWFAREAMAKLLNLDNRVRWADVQQTIDVETADADAFREQFAPWDFTLPGNEAMT